MRRTIAGVVLVLCAVACVCASSLFTILHTVDGMETLRMQSLERAGEGDLEGAEEYLTKLAGHWREMTPRLEILTDHNDLHNVAEGITDARISLERGFLDDYYQAMALLGEGIAHIRAQEELSLANLL